MIRRFLRLGTLALGIATGFSAYAAQTVTLLNVSYDPTRELYEDLNKAFALQWERKHGQEVKFRQSHGGSGKQARAVIDGLPADVVTLGLAYDIDMISEKSGMLPKEWQSRLPNNSTPFASTIVFLVRKGNPKNIKDWDDLIREDVKVITPNPKTSGGARWNYLAAYGYALRAHNQDEALAKEFLGKLFKNVPVLDAGARASTTTFIQRKLGDVLISWENEAFLARDVIGKEAFDIVIPSLSVLAEPPVAVVDKNVDKNGTRAVAEAYLHFLYTPEAQEIAVKHHYRPTLANVSEQYKDRFPSLTLLNINDFGGWKVVQQKHFSDNGVFDEIFSKGR